MSKSEATYEEGIINWATILQIARHQERSNILLIEKLRRQNPFSVIHSVSLSPGRVWGGEYYPKGADINLTVLAGNVDFFAEDPETLQHYFKILEYRDQIHIPGGAAYLVRGRPKSHARILFVIPPGLEATKYDISTNLQRESPEQRDERLLREEEAVYSIISP